MSDGTEKQEVFTHVIAQAILDHIESLMGEHPELLGATVSLVYDPAIGSVKPNTAVAGDMSMPGMPILALHSLVDAVDFIHELHAQQVGSGLRLLQKMEERLRDRSTGSGPNSAGGSVAEDDSGAH